MTKYAALFDLHYGYERRNGHKVPLHDMRAFGAALAFLKDFRPDTLILGGDILDCGAISHHNKGKPGLSGGLVLRDGKAVSLITGGGLPQSHAQLVGAGVTYDRLVAFLSGKTFDASKFKD